MTSPMPLFLQQLRRSVLVRDGAGLTDGQLLTRFLERRDEAAFAVLVRRHGPMVWGVCRRLLRNHHDAEDAFQATFLVLTRKAASVRPREMVANWLYGVACTTAHRVKVATAKRRAKEKQVAEMPEPEAVPQDLWRDLQPLLDRALSRLPDKYRVVVLLCDLEGKTRKEAARQLGCPEGTVAGRLARARVMLAKRLARHGLALSGGALAVLLSQKAAACIPDSVVFSTIKAAGVFAAGQATSAGISVKVAALTEGVLKTMLLNKLKITTAIVLGIFTVSVIAGLGVSTLPAWGQEQKGPAKKPRGQPQAAQKEKPKAGHIFLIRQHDPDPNSPPVGDNEPHLARVSPDGKEDTWLTKNLKGEGQPRQCGAAAVSPDGRRIAYGVTSKEEQGKGFDNDEIFLKDLDNKKAGVSLKVPGIFWCWSPDGRSLVVSAVDGTSISHQILDFKTKQTKPLQLPEVKAPENAELLVGHLITDWSRDGKWFLTTVMAKGEAEAELYLVKSDGSEAKRIGKGFGGRLSPDGKTVLCLDLKWKGEVADTRLVLVDVKTGKRQRASQETNGQFVGGYCWSPDGKKIAYVWRRDREHENEAWETFLMVMDADGQNSRVVLAEKSSRTEHWYNPFGCPDWR
ncbi:MAG TPA: sigma-70 family RNA polymerase sigma factor [Gemmataceae bacterium]